MSETVTPPSVNQGAAGGSAWPVSVSSVPLPTGAATETTLATMLQEGADITGATMPTGGSHARGWLSAIWKLLAGGLPAALGAGGGLKVDGSGTALPVDTELPAAVALNGTNANSTSAPIVGAAVLFNDGTNLVEWTGTGALGPAVHISKLPALPAGSNVIGHVITDTGSTTAVSNTVATSSAASSQADGHSATIGATTDTSSANTLVGLLKKLISLLPTALVGGRLSVDGSGVTQPVSATSLPLPTGAATAAKQPALGTAGTPASDVLSVQGAGPTATPLPVSDGGGSLTTDTPQLPPALTAGGAVATGLVDANTGSYLSSFVISGGGGYGLVTGATTMYGPINNHSFTGAGQLFSFSCLGYPAFQITVQSLADGGSAYAGLQLKFHGYPDGSFPASIAGTRLGDGLIEGGDTATAALTNATKTWVISALGYQYVSVTCEALASGTAVMWLGAVGEPISPPWVGVADGANVALGGTTDTETASGQGSLISIVKRLRTLLAGGLPSALGAGGGLKVDGSGTALPVTGTVTNQATTSAQDFSFTCQNTPGTVAITGVTGLGGYRSASFYLKLQGNTGGTLDIYIQTSPDGGTTWVDYAHFAQLAAGASAIARAFTLTKYAQQTTLQTVGTGTSPALAASTIIGGDWGDRMRILYVNGASTTVGKSQTVQAVFST